VSTVEGSVCNLPVHDGLQGGCIVKPVNVHPHLMCHWSLAFARRAQALPQDMECIG
jgi:hypothetical protein